MGIGSQTTRLWPLASYPGLWSTSYIATPSFQHATGRSEFYQSRYRMYSPPKRPGFEAIGPSTRRKCKFLRKIFLAWLNPHWQVYPIYIHVQRKFSHKSLLWWGTPNRDTVPTNGLNDIGRMTKQAMPLATKDFS